MSSTHDRNKDVFSLKEKNQHPQTFEILFHTELIRFVLNLKYKFPLTVWFITCIAYSGNYELY